MPVYLATMLIVISVACVGFALVSWLPLVGSALLALVASVSLLVTLVTWASNTIARVIVVLGQVVGVAVNLPFLGMALMIGFIGFAQGTDTSVRENTNLAIGGFSFSAIATITLLALLAVGHPRLPVLFATAFVGNGALLVFALYIVTIGASESNSINDAAIFYGVAFASVNAIAVRAAYRIRFFGGQNDEPDGM